MTIKKKKVMKKVNSKPKKYCPKNMIRHEGTSIGLGPIFTCDFCITPIVSEEAARRHDTSICSREYFYLLQNPLTKEQKSIPDLPFKCKTCRMSFNDTESLDEHVFYSHDPPAELVNSFMAYFDL